MNNSSAYFSLCIALMLVACGTVETSAPSSGFEWPQKQDATVGIEDYLGRTHFRIVTSSATYLVDSASGGLSSMIDADGNDWIAFSQEPWGEYPASAASAYRGVPNLIFRGEFDGSGHPGHAGVVTDIVGANQVLCHTPGGPWAWTWSFLPTHVQLDVHNVSDTLAYWFLYEGPAGGKYEPLQTYYATNASKPAFAQLDHFKGQEEVALRNWYYFGNGNVSRTLFMVQVERDNLLDHYSILGNDTVGINSPDGMLVAGFGRAPGAVPLLQKPNRFLIGFSEGEGISAMAYAQKTQEIVALINDHN